MRPHARRTLRRARCVDVLSPLVCLTEHHPSFTPPFFFVKPKAAGSVLLGNMQANLIRLFKLSVLAAINAKRTEVQPKDLKTTRRTMGAEC